MNLIPGTLRSALCVGICALMLPVTLFAASLTQGEKDTIFIGELKVQPSVIEGARKKGRGHELNRILETLDTQFISALNGTRVFQLVDRKRFSDLKLEQDFAQSGNVDQDDKHAAKSGKMAGAKFAFLPMVDTFEDRSETSEYQKIGRSDMKRKLYLSVTVQVIDTTSGKLLPDSPSVQLKREESVEGGRLGQVSGSEEAIVELAREMAQKLSQELVGLLRPAKILSVTGKQIMINRGSEAGFAKGDLVEIYASQDVKDEDSGEIFRNEVPVGRATVIRLDKKSCYATIGGDDMGITKGCLVRSIQTKSSKAELAAEDVSASGSGDKPLKW
jgi:curli biogenesis system outer membrane secretion channel CsgG